MNILRTPKNDFVIYNKKRSNQLSNTSYFKIARLEEYYLKYFYRRAIAEE